jgi:hypothetical protein
MSHQSPLKLEFFYKSEPHPPGSSNVTTLLIKPSGELKSHVAADFAVSVGTGADLQTSLFIVSSFLIERVREQTPTALSDTIHFTDGQGNDHAFQMQVS